MAHGSTVTYIKWYENDGKNKYNFEDDEKTVI